MALRHLSLGDIRELENLLSRKKVTEADFQGFFDRNRDFLRTWGHPEVHSDVVLARRSSEFRDEFDRHRLGRYFCSEMAQFRASVRSAKARMLTGMPARNVNTSARRTSVHSSLPSARTRAWTKTTTRSAHGMKSSGSLWTSAQAARSTPIA